MASTQSAFVWHELLTNDVAAAKTFYSKVIGWGMNDMPMFGGTYTTLHAGSVAIGGMMAMPADAREAGMPGFWAPYLEVEDVDAAADKLAGLKGRVHRAPQDIPNVGRFAVVSDPQGAMFNLFKSSGVSVRGNGMAVGEVGWNELHALDQHEAWDFYSKMFGWQKGDAMDMGPMGVYQLFTVNGQAVGAMFNSSAAKPKPFWLSYFNVANIDAAAKRLAEAKGKTMNGPMEVPGGRWIIQAGDNQGTAFAMLGAR